MRGTCISMNSTADGRFYSKSVSTTVTTYALLEPLLVIVHNEFYLVWVLPCLISYVC